MAIELLMPQLGLTMNEGTITEWAKKEGDSVSKGDILFYVENDKAVIPFEAQNDGVLARILVNPMKTVPVGTVVGILAAHGETIQLQPEKTPAPSVPESEKTASARISTSSSKQQSMKESPPAEPEKIKVQSQTATKLEPNSYFTLASPYARKIAMEQGIELSQRAGSGPEGAIIARDIQIGASIPSAAAKPAQVVSAGAQPKAAPPRTLSYTVTSSTQRWEDQKLNRIRQVAAERLTKSWQEIPQFTLSIEARAQGLIDAQNSFKAKGTKVSFTAILAKLLASALTDYPLLNSSWLGNDTIRVYHYFNISIAVDSPDGLVVPTLFNCENRGIRELSENLSELAEKARSRTLSPESMQDGTISLSNLGMFGITRFRAIVNPPQCAILSVGAVTRRPIEVNNAMEFIPMIEISLTADHRIVDGAYGARFLEHLKDYIENPVLALS